MRSILLPPGLTSPQLWGWLVVGRQREEEEEQKESYQNDTLYFGFFDIIQDILGKGQIFVSLQGKHWAAVLINNCVLCEAASIGLCGSPRCIVSMTGEKMLKNKNTQLNHTNLGKFRENVFLKIMGGGTS